MREKGQYGPEVGEEAIMVLRTRLFLGAPRGLISERLAQLGRNCPEGIPPRAAYAEVGFFYFIVRLAGPRERCAGTAASSQWAPIPFIISTRNDFRDYRRAAPVTRNASP